VTYTNQKHDGAPNNELFVAVLAVKLNAVQILVGNILLDVSTMMAVLLYHNQAIFELRTDNDGDDKKSSPIKSSDHTGSFSSSSYQESRFLPSFFFFFIFSYRRFIASAPQCGPN
jgi:hypothetical protein